MPQVYPFRAVQFSSGPDLSALIAPPYDVLDSKAKARLLARSEQNIVGVDLPHVPPKELGPAASYEEAGRRYRQMLESKRLARRAVPAMFAYRQTFEFDGATHQRCGMAATIDAVSFGTRAGGGILPHEETFSGPKEDRLALMNATRAQLSPIFGLHADDSGAATKLVRSIMSSRRPDSAAKMDYDSVLHEVWAVDDQATISAYQTALAGEDIFIADGHHRYNTQLNYLKQLESKGPVSADHPARKCMMVLIGMSDPGLIIGPTHRVLGGMKGYSLDAFRDAAANDLRFEPVRGDAAALDSAVKAAKVENTIGLYDFALREAFFITPQRPDPLVSRFASKPREWRTLDVAIIQYLIVEAICQPKLNGNEAVKWAFPHSIAEVLEIGKGAETGAGGGKNFVPQVALIVRPTPLSAVRAVSRANELMPQKSTFFYPKLATGLFLNALE
ncbi:MAG: DUF1015 domain-containing protein [Phycisphaeraceae bacterium]|nr:DUF1015 domain-containing protein [Phycisphaeraceae bacterium]